MKNNSVVSTKRRILGIYGKGILAAFIFALLILVVLTLLITYTNISESIIPMTTSIVMLISTLISGMYTGSKLKKKGWLHGVIVGIIYMTIIIIMSWGLISDFKFEMYILYKSLIGIIVAGIGGIIGVNLK